MSVVLSLVFLWIIEECSGIKAGKESCYGSFVSQPDLGLCKSDWPYEGSVGTYGGGAAPLGDV